MKVYSAAQIKEIDAYTIEHEPISSVNLMERASIAVAHEIMERCIGAAALALGDDLGSHGGADAAHADKAEADAVLDGREFRVRGIDVGRQHGSCEI